MLRFSGRSTAVQTLSIASDRRVVPQGYAVVGAGVHRDASDIRTARRNVVRNQLLLRPFGPFQGIPDFGRPVRVVAVEKVFPFCAGLPESENKTRL